MKRSLHLKVGSDFSKVIPLKNGKYSIGRGEESSIQIESMQVSRHHADILVSEESVEVVDYKSANGTLLNGVPVKQSPLKEGDQITIGQAVLEFHMSLTEEESVLKRATIIRPHPQSKTGLHDRTIRLKLLILGAILLPSLVGLSLMAFSFHHSISENASSQSLTRGQDLVVQLALENRELLRMGNELLLNIEDVSRQPGVMKAFIYNKRGRILAPLGVSNEEDIDPFVTEALSQSSSRRLLPSPELPNGTRILVHPIRVFEDQRGQYETIGAAKIVFDAREGQSQPVPTVAIVVFCFFLTGLLVLGISFWMTKKLTEPISKLSDQVDQWRYGQQNIDVHTPFHEWQSLYRSLIKWMEDLHR